MKPFGVALFTALNIAIAPTIALAREKPGPLKVVFVNPGKAGEVFWDMVAQSMSAAGGKLGMELETLSGERNFRRMQELGLSVTRREHKPDFLILVNEENAAVPVLEAAEASKIKTFLLSNSLTGADAERLGPPRSKLAWYIGSLVPDMEIAGARMARAVIDEAKRKKLHAADGKIHILALGGDESTPISISRNRGMQEVVARDPDVVLDRLLFANWNATEAETLTDNFLQWAERKQIRIAGIWAANDPMALGAMQSAKRAGFKPGGNLIIAGLNWSPEALEKVESGELLMSDGGHFLGGALSMLLLRDYADGCDFAQTSATQEFRTSPVTRERATAIRKLVSGRRFELLDYNRLRPSSMAACGQYDFSAEALLRVLDSAANTP